MSNQKKALKIFLLIVMVVIVLGYSISSVYGLKHEPVDRSSTLVIGGISDLPPYCYTDDNGSLRGFNVDVMSAIALELGINIEIKKVKEEDILNELKSKNIDAVLGIQYNPDYVNNLRYSKPFIKNKFSIYVKNYNTSIRNVDDLRYKKVSVYKNDPSISRLKSIKGIRLFVTETPEDAIMLLAYGMTEACVGNKLSGKYYLLDSSYRNKIKIVGEELYTLPSGIATLRENKDIINLINKGLDKVDRKGTLDIITKKWFGEKISSSSAFLRKLLIALSVLGCVITLIAAVFYRINKLLKREIEARTKKIEEETRFKEEIIDSLFDGLITLDTYGKILAINYNARQIIGDFDSELINCNIKDTQLGQLFDIKSIEEVIVNKCKLAQLENKVKLNGQERFIQYNITPVLITNHVIKGITLTFRDITEEKRMKKKIIIKDKMETMGRLTASIAHEIRNPLTSIDMYIKLLPEKIDNESFRQKMIEDIPREICRLNNMITDLLDYARPLPPQKKYFSMFEEINSSLNLVINQIDKNNIMLNVNINKEIMIYFDKQQFKQIILNLVINAMDALKEVDKPIIQIKGHDVFGEIKLDIINNGPPIADEIIDSIFEPFFSTKNEGYGLGLSIVDQLVKENGAEIFLDIAFKDGVKFTLVVPKHVEQQLLDEEGDSYEEAANNR